MKKNKRVKLIAPLAAAATLLTATAINAELILLEQFDYEGVDTPLHGFDGGQGFVEPWTVTGWSRNYDIGRTAYANGAATTTNDRGGLEFEGLDTAGSGLGRFGTAGQRQAQRALSAASKAALTADGTTIWFSVLAGAPSNGNKYGTMIFATDPIIAQQGAPNNGNLSSATGQGFGVGFRIDNGGVAGGGSGSPNAVAFIDSESATVAVGTFVPPITEGGTHHDTSLIVGKINWKANGTEDELFLFNMAAAADPEPAEGDAIASLSADFDQSNFSLISLQDTGSVIYDEIRFGTSFSDVTAGASAAQFRIRAFSYSAGDDTVTLTWDSNEGDRYAVRFTADLVDWGGDLNDDYPADLESTTTTATFNLGPAGLTGAERVFFRVEQL
jgi:hypothetical protein